MNTEKQIVFPGVNNPKGGPNYSERGGYYVSGVIINKTLAGSSGTIPAGLGGVYITPFCQIDKPTHTLVELAGVQDNSDEIKLQRNQIFNGARITKRGSTLCQYVGFDIYNVKYRRQDGHFGFGAAEMDPPSYEIKMGEAQALVALSQIHIGTYGGNTLLGLGMVFKDVSVIQKLYNKLNEQDFTEAKAMCMADAVDPYLCGIYRQVDHPACVETATASSNDPGGSTGDIASMIESTGLFKEESEESEENEETPKVTNAAPPTMMTMDNLKILVIFLLIVVVIYLVIRKNEEKAESPRKSEPKEEPLIQTISVPVESV
jgi:hypothetical protein